jgi:catechol 2,3-dioxygenase-like lactoylglutathione lyase family enzyme
METATSTKARLNSIWPFFIVRDVQESVAFYRDRLGFDLMFIGPDDDPYWAVVTRDDIGIMLKAIVPDVQPTPNPSRHPLARWDAYIYTPDPERLAEEFAGRGVEFHESLGINSDQLLGFEIRDANGYVLYFGRPA